MHAFQKWTVTVYSSFMDFWTQDLCFKTCMHKKITDEVQRAHVLIIQSKTHAHYVGTSEHMHCMGA